MGPQKVTATGRPGRTVVSWATGGENGSSTYTVLDSDGRTLGTSTSSPVTLNGLAPGAHDIRVRQTVDDGRVYTSALRRLVVPAEWVFVSSGSGVRAYGVEADAASADGLLVGESANPQMTNVHLSASPTRSEARGCRRVRPSCALLQRPHSPGPLDTRHDRRGGTSALSARRRRPRRPAARRHPGRGAGSVPGDPPAGPSLRSGDRGSGQLHVLPDRLGARRSVAARHPDGRSRAVPDEPVHRSGHTRPRSLGRL